MPEIIIDVTAEAETTIEVHGCAGPSCSDLTRTIEEALGRTVSDRRKPEFDAAVESRESRVQSQRG